MPQPGVFHYGDQWCDGCHPGQSEVFVERLVGGGSYQYASEISCSAQVSDEVNKIKKGGPLLVDKLLPGSGKYAGPVIDTVTNQLVTQLRNANQGGELGKLINQHVGGPAECHILAIALPKDATRIDGFPYFLCGDGDKGWGAAVKDANGQYNCSVGFAAWKELPQLHGENGTVVSALFMNWSQRSRWAVMGIHYYTAEPPPAGTKKSKK
jgi:hypothetical protein